MQMWLVAAATEVVAMRVEEGSGTSYRVDHRHFICFGVINEQA